MQKMSEKIHLNFLITCGILFQVILGTFADKSIMESSNLLVRNKRVISNFSHAIMRMTIQQIPYVVQLHDHKGYACMGNVLYYNVILTAAHCVEDRGNYYVLSGSEYVNHGTRHEINEVILHPQYHPNQYANDLALLKINPGISIQRSPNRLIKLNNGFVPPDTVGLVSSWGCIGKGRDGELYPNQLRSIVTSVISQSMCQHFYRIYKHYHVIDSLTDRTICTLDDTEGSGCSSGDSGAPLVISNELVGVMAWNEDNGEPDVFMNLTHPAYRTWILQNIPTHSHHVNSHHYVHN